MEGSDPEGLPMWQMGKLLIGVVGRFKRGVCHFTIFELTLRYLLK